MCGRVSRVTFFSVSLQNFCLEGIFNKLKNEIKHKMQFESFA